MHRNALTSVAAASLVVAAALVALPRLHAASGTPDLTGTWTGVAKAKEFYLDPGEKNGKDHFPITLAIAQTAGDATVNVTLSSDEGTQTFALTGKVGENSLWAISSDPLNPFILSVHADKPGKHLKGIGIYATAGESEEFVLKLSK